MVAGDSSGGCIFCGWRGFRRMESWEWKIENGEWTIESGEWRMKNEEWKRRCVYDSVL
jgi:hypothetical protein